jgi:hypothetical protein
MAFCHPEGRKGRLGRLITEGVGLKVFADPCARLKWDCSESCRAKEKPSRLKNLHMYCER